MKVLSVDPGERRLGIAVSDEMGLFARPLTILQHISRPLNAQRILDLALEQGAKLVLIGVPYDSDGGLGPKARASMKLLDALQALEHDLTILAWDESFSTQKVEALRRQQGLTGKRQASPKDAEAAAFLLQDYLDTMQTQGGTHAA